MVPPDGLKGEALQKNCSKIVSEYDQEIPQSQTADYPVARLCIVC